MQSFIYATLVVSAMAGIEKASEDLQKMCMTTDSPNCGERGFDQQTTQNLDHLNEYGCWCYFDDDHGRGKSHPIDGIDELCKILHDGYECAMRDAEDEGTTCIPWEVDYNSAVGGDADAELAEKCFAANPTNSCAARACTIEGTFVEDLLAYFINGGVISNSLKHANGFDTTTDCPVKKGGSSGEKKCCGNYPERFPFRTLGGDRGCCNNRTFNVLSLKCCDDGSIKFNCK